MNFLNNYIILVIVGICLCIGYILKNIVSTDKVNRFIPLIMAIIGLLLNVWISGTVSPDIILGGMISGLSSTGLYEAFKQFLKV